MQGLGNAVSDLSQLLAQAIVMPFRRPRSRRTPRRPLPASGAGARDLRARVRGQLWLASGAIPDDVLLELIHQVGGRGARVVVLAAAGYSFALAGQRYLRYLQRFGVDKAQLLDLSTRQRAEEADLAVQVVGADLVVLGGGSPSQWLAVVGGTGAEAALWRALVRGTALAAWGAAAEAVGALALVGGGTAPVGQAPPARGAAGATLAGGELLLVPGLGLIPGTMVAATPMADGRLGQLFAVALAGSLQVLVLDRGAVLRIQPGWRGEVRAGTVLAAGGQEPQGRSGAPLGAVYTRVAPAGWRLDLGAQLVLPPGRPGQAASAAAAAPLPPHGLGGS